MPHFYSQFELCVGSENGAIRREGSAMTHTGGRPGYGRPQLFKSWARGSGASDKVSLLRHSEGHVSPHGHVAESTAHVNPHGCADALSIEPNQPRHQAGCELSVVSGIAGVGPALTAAVTPWQAVPTGRRPRAHSGLGCPGRQDQPCGRHASGELGAGKT